ncbi:MAG TPA: hypothetical protein DHW65_02395 [Dehalococcoidia bacterium]|nr:hypothetical protein [Chloroflexota bacterium]MQF96141.1 hypothetical protein [SAR202 cluster bacterium]HAA94274.1 hypothetical protein [Dehalococcoidia bacterium]HCL25183.1 hypothetical protein [Dehalococcoidia bacterium]|tara:strand:- start:306 stop:641 length:336 start_codon:yes stop_codon:yes gene_type:complete
MKALAAGRKTKARGLWPRGIGVAAIVAIGVGGLLVAGGMFGRSASVPAPPPDHVVDPVSEAYSFAVERPDVLAYMPCYCGCSGEGHLSNEDCFVHSRLSNGTAVLDSHGGA